MNTARFSSRSGTAFRFLAFAALLGTAAVLATMNGARQAQAANGVPRPDHVVILIEENHDYNQIIGNSCCPYINAQASAGALMTNSHGVEHPSQPNYFDLFAGSNQGITDNSCPNTFSTPNLAQAVIAAGLSFGSYSENLPSVGSTVCTASGGYARKHNPWVSFSNVPASTNMPFTSFPTDFNQLPTVAMITPNLCNDMHDCSPATGDAWVQSRLNAYIQWAKTHNSLFILTFDENSGSAGNQIPTIFVGPMVVPGQYNQNINHFNVLRTIEDMYNLPYAGQSASAAPITGIWVGAATPTKTNTPVGPTRTPTPGGTTTVSFQNGALPSSGYSGMIDSVIKQGSATTNYGSAATLDVDGDDGSGVDKSILLKWDLASIPAGKTVNSASLSFRVVDASNSTYQIYQLKRNWVESQATWNIFSSGNNWQTAGAFGANDRGSTVLGSTGPAAVGVNYTIALNASGLALVQSWINNPATNFGVLIANASNTDGLDFSSSEAAGAADRPKLTVTYH